MPQPVLAATRQPSGIGKERVPVEFIGRARDLRRRIAAVTLEADDAMTALLKPLAPKLIERRRMPPAVFRPTLTHRALYRMAGGWRNLPAFGRLACSVDDAAIIIGKPVLLGEVRCCASRVRLDGWAESELALELRERCVCTAPPGFEEHVLAVVGLHAMARKIQRSARRDDLATLRSLCPVARSYEQAVKTGGEFEVPTEDGGRWIGAVMALDAKRPVLAVRTYLG